MSILWIWVCLTILLIVVFTLDYVYNYKVRVDQASERERALEREWQLDMIDAGFHEEISQGQRVWVRNKD